MPVAAVSLGMGVLSFGAGRSDAKKARELQKQQIALQRESLAFAQKRYAEANELYGETRKKLVDSANEGVKADLQGVADRASADVAQSFQKSGEEVDRNLSRYGINPNSGRAIAAKMGSGVARAAAESGLINTSRRAEQKYADETTWNRRAEVGRMASSELSGTASGVQSGYQGVAGAYGNAANSASASANAAYGVAGQFAGIGLSAAYDHYNPASVKPPVPATPASVANGGLNYGYQNPYPGQKNS